MKDTTNDLFYLELSDNIRCKGMFFSIRNEHWGSFSLDYYFQRIVMNLMRGVMNNE